VNFTGKMEQFSLSSLGLTKPKLLCKIRFAFLWAEKAGLSNRANSMLFKPLKAKTKQILYIDPA